MAQTTSTTSHNLGEILLAEGLITQEQFNDGLQEYDQSERPLSRIFVEMGAITEGVKIGVLQKRFGCKMIAADQIAPRPNAMAALSRSTCEKYRVVPIRIEDGELLVAMDDPTDSRTVNSIEALSSMPIRPYLAKTSDISKVIDRLPEDQEEIVEPKKRGWFVRAFSMMTLILVCGIPIAAFVLALLYYEPFQEFWTEKLNFDPFEQILIFVLLWCAWAIVAYWINDVLFGQRQEET